MNTILPFPISVRPWSELSQSDRSFFCFDDEYLPLHPNHAAQIGLLPPADARRLRDWALSAYPAGWPDQVYEDLEDKFQFDELLNIHDCWNDLVRVAGVRKWLYHRGIPFQRIVYLMYDNSCVVQTTWHLTVKYWDAFAWSVGYAMVAMDHTLQWACNFHHEEVIVFGSRKKVQIT